MPKSFNITGVCIPELHYMADTRNRINEITANYIEKGCYFTINRARQSGKTTTLYLLEKHLQEKYTVIRFSFEAADELFTSLYSFATGLIQITSNELKRQKADENILKKWQEPLSKEFPFIGLSTRITELCQNSSKKIVLMIDVTDKSSDNQMYIHISSYLKL